MEIPCLLTAIIAYTIIHYALNRYVFTSSYLAAILLHSRDLKRFCMMRQLTKTLRVREA